MGYNVFNTHIIGEKHIRDGTICQDYSKSYIDQNKMAAIVADGHGSENYVRSDRGSRLVCECALKCILEFTDKIDGKINKENSDKILRQLEKSIISAWNNAVNEDYAKEPFTDIEIDMVSENIKDDFSQGLNIEKAYGTTLVSAVITTDYWFGLQIGDGKCVILDKDKNFSIPIPPNDKCFLNVTTSICDTNAIDEFRHFFDTSIPIALFTGTDGVDDSFINIEQLFSLYDKIYNNFISVGYDEGLKQINDFLPQLTKKGSGDDVSISGIINIAELVD